MSTSRRSAVSHNLLLAVCVSLASLILLEGGLRLVLLLRGSESLPEIAYVTHDGFYTYPANTTRIFVNESGQPITLRLDGHGLRNPPEAFDCSYVWLLGDSFIMGSNTAEDVTVVGLLRSAGFAAYNAGMDGFSTCNALALLKTLLAARTPKAVVLCFYLGNDFRDNYYCVPPQPSATDTASSGTTAEKPPPWTRNFIGFAKKITSNILILKIISEIVQVGINTRSDDPMPSYCCSEILSLETKDRQEFRKSLDNTRAILAAMRDELVSRNIQFYLLAIPSKAQTVQSLMEISACYREPNFEKFSLQAIRNGFSFENPAQQFLKIGSQLNIPTLSLLPAFRLHDGYALFGQFDRHWNVLGQHVTATALIDLLSR